MSQTISAVYDGKVLRPVEQPDLPKNASVVLEIKEVHVVTNHEKRYQLSDLVGTLQWQGDPLTEQEKLRNEW
jgi:hypothetical protein